MSDNITLDFERPGLTKGFYCRTVRCVGDLASIPREGDAVQFGFESFSVHKVVWFHNEVGVLDSVRVVLR